MCDEEKIICPFCSQINYSEETDWNECKHFYSREEDGYDWWGDDRSLSIISNISTFFNEYLECDYLNSDERDEVLNELDGILKSLEVSKFLDLKSEWEWGFIDENIELLCNQISFMRDVDEGSSPSTGGGVNNTIFVGDRTVIKKFVREFKTLYDKLLEFDKKNKKMFV